MNAASRCRGASIGVVGTAIGTTADADGQFALVLPQPEAETLLEARFIGYQSAQRAIRPDDAPANVVFQLAVDALQLDEIVVTGLSAAASRKQLGHAISTVSARQLETAGTSALDKALSGKLAGALVQQKFGQSGRRRDHSACAAPAPCWATADPLYVVDGVVVNNSSPELIRLGGGAQNRLGDFNPHDVERVEVVKGAAAAAPVRLARQQRRRADLYQARRTGQAAAYLHGSFFNRPSAPNAGGQQGPG